MAHRLGDADLQRILQMAREKFEMKPRIAFAGFGKAGKSSLFNAIYGTQASRVTAKTNGTRSALTCEKFGMEFTDMPGIGTKAFTLERVLEAGVLDRQHIVIHVLNGVAAISADDVLLHCKLEDAASHRLTVANKADLLTGEERAEYAVGVHEQLGLTGREFSFVSARTGEGVPDLIRMIVHALPDALKDAFIAQQQADHEVKQARVRMLIYSKATVCAAIALLPVPVADLALITPVQVAMVASIGHLYGVPVTWERTLELLTTLGAGVGLREVARQLIKLVPGAGGVISATMAFAGTVGLGEAANAWFRAQGRIGAAELREAYRKAAEGAKGKYGELSAEVTAARADVEALESALDAGTLTQAEYQERLAALGGGS